MTDVRIEREFKVTPERLFEFVTARENILTWFGYAHMRFVDENMDFSRVGPWHSKMLSDEGNTFHISGQVTHVDPPKSVGFTWGWHDPEGNRGDESHVMFVVTATASGARLIIDHRDLGEDEFAKRHEQGWINAVNRMAEGLAA